MPLSLTLDACSFEHLKGEKLEEAQFLCELCRTPALDGIWSWKGNPIVVGIPQAELRPLRNDDRAVSLAGQSGFIGGVRMWSQYEKTANEYGFSGDERDWFVYYGALTHFHQSSDRHYLVTADSRLLEESEREDGFFRKGRYRLVSIERALFLAGLAMQAQGEIFYEAPQPGHSIHTSSYDAEQFSRRLTLTTAQSVDRLAFALADDRRAPRVRTTWTDEDRKAIRRFRWLLGLPSAEVTTAGLPYLSGE